MMKRIILPLLLLLCFYVESIFTDYFPPGTWGIDKILAPRFLLVLLILMGIFYFRNRALIFAAIFGLLFDLYFTEIIGVYLFLFPIAVYVAAKMAKILQANIFSAVIIEAICLALIEVLVYGFNFLILQKDIDFNEFALIRLYPTLIVNILFLLIVYYPFSRLLLQRKKEELKE